MNNSKIIIHTVLTCVVQFQMLHLGTQFEGGHFLGISLGINLFGKAGIQLQEVMEQRQR